MTDDQNTEPVQRRTPLPSVRVLVVITLLFALATLFVTLVLSYHRQITAIEHIEAMGGRVSVEFGRSRWLRSMLGSERMRGLNNVEFISFAQTGATDRDLGDLTQFPNLKQLDLGNTRVSDDGIAQIAPRLPALEYISLEATLVTDDGLQHLSHLDQLQLLSLSSTGITGDGLHHLAGLPALTTIELNGTLLTDNAVDNFAGIPKLKAITLAGTRISDQGMQRLSRISRLTSLTLNDTHITDASVPHILALKNLRALWLLHTRLSAEAITTLRRGLPHCRVIDKFPK